MTLAAIEHAPTRAKKRPAAPIPAARPYARALFTQLARRFIMPAEATRASALIFDLEADGLLATVTKVHCIVILDLGDDRVHEYGPGEIARALAHLARADTLIGHNVLSYDLPVLRKLYGWSPPAACRIVDTLVAGRLILPNLGDVDAEVAARAKDAAFGRLRGARALRPGGFGSALRRSVPSSRTGPSGRPKFRPVALATWALTSGYGNSCSRTATPTGRSISSTPSPRSAIASPPTARRSTCRGQNSWRNPGRRDAPSWRSDCVHSSRR